MNAAELVALMDAAMHSGGPVVYLSGVASCFDGSGRRDDASATRRMAALFERGEIEMLLSMRAEWRAAAAQLKP